MADPYKTKQNNRNLIGVFTEQISHHSSALPPKFVGFLRSLVSLIEHDKLPSDVISVLSSSLAGLPVRLQELTAAQARTEEPRARQRAHCALGQQICSIYITTVENSPSDASCELLATMLGSEAILLTSADLPAPLSRSSTAVSDQDDDADDDQAGLNFVTDVDWSRVPLRVNRPFFAQLFVMSDEVIGACQAFCERLTTSPERVENAAAQRMTLKFLMIALTNMTVDIPVDALERVSWFKRLSELMKNFYGTAADILLVP
ncbi:hypothetical protein BV898_13935 [Hypsibius exemplaris]|uniref:Uncharacterized protein n=1 Tax=Hypsibius exemplaris TaxID=2072580 RepID=A0A1W0W956_HYPEX|nr:hypothetical protein BV898_13935 [Hypsibius exemplaris]